MKQLKKKKLNRQKTQTKRTAVLLTELETAARQTLIEDFSFDEARADAFMDKSRERFQAGQTELAGAQANLGGVAQLFGLAGMQTLKDYFQFKPQQIDAWLSKLLRRAEQKRRGGQA